VIVTPAVDGAARGDLGQALPLLVAEVAAEEQLQLDAVDLALARIARKPRLDPVERPALAFGIQGKSGCDPLQRLPTLYKEIGRFRLAGLGSDCRALGAVLGEFSESF
jgi:hypothetical protein